MSTTTTLTVADRLGTLKATIARMAEVKAARERKFVQAKQAEQAVALAVRDAL